MASQVRQVSAVNGNVPFGPPLALQSRFDPAKPFTLTRRAISRSQPFLCRHREALLSVEAGP